MIIEKVCVKKYERKTTNFIDNNDNFVGFDVDSQHCCEYAYYKFFKKENDRFNNGFKEIKLSDLPESAEFIGVAEFSIEDDGSNYFNIITFEISGGYYLEIVNIHNGYYAHVFEYKINLNQEKGSL